MKNYLIFLLFLGNISFAQDALVIKVPYQYMEACELGKEECKPITISRSKNQVVILELPCGGTITDASLSGPGLDSSLTIHIMHDDCPPKYVLTDFSDGAYSVYMTGCNVGGSFRFSLTTNQKKPTNYSSAITFLNYEDFEYGVKFMEDILQLELVMDKGFARVYKVNEKAFVGIVQKRDSNQVSGNTLFSLTTQNVESEYERVRQLEVQNLSELMIIEAIPLKSFFFDDKEGHKFEIQQFLKEEDVQRF